MGELPDSREEAESGSGDRDWPGKQERQREVETEASGGGLADTEKLPVLGGQRRLLQTDFETSTKLVGKVSNHIMMLSCNNVIRMGNRKTYIVKYYIF